MCIIFYIFGGCGGGISLHVLHFCFVGSGREVTLYLLYYFFLGGGGGGGVTSDFTLISFLGGGGGGVGG